MCVNTSLPHSKLSCLRVAMQGLREFSGCVQYTQTIKAKAGRTLINQGLGYCGDVWRPF